MPEFVLMPPDPVAQEKLEDFSGERSKFLWNQQRYALENIKLAGLQGGIRSDHFRSSFEHQFCCPQAILYVHLTHATSGSKLFVDVFDIAGVICLISALLLSAWCIAPRNPERRRGFARLLGGALHAIPDPDAFRRENSVMSQAMATDYLCEQVYYMSVICVRKHHLVARAIICAGIGACCIAIALIAR